MKRIIATGIPDFESLRMNQRFHLMNRKQGISWIAVALVALLLFLLPVSALMEEENQNNTGTIYDDIIDDNNSDIYQIQDEHENVFIWLNGDGSELARQSFADSGASPSLSPTPVKADDDTYSYTFSSWDIRPREVNGVTYTIYVPQFTSTPIVRHKLTIHYQYAGGGQASADYTADIKEGADYSVTSPTLARYTVDSETVSGTMGTSDIETTVTYTAYTPTIRFLDTDENVLQAGQVAWDTTPVYGGPTPTRDSTPEHTYAFAGWDPAIEAVTKDQDYTTIFTESPREYTIRFLNADGTVLQSGSVAWGQTPAYTEATPTKAATAQYTYAFNAWTPAIKAVDGDQDYTATFNQSLRGYTIRFLNADGTELKKETLAFGSTPGYTGDIPTQAATAQYTFNFQGWTPAIKAVEGDADYTAVYAESLNSYTVRFLDEDGSLLQSTDYAWGETPEYTGQALSKAGDAQYSYAFSNWNPEIKAVEGDADYTAAYAQTVNEYTVRFLNADGAELQSSPVPWGQTPAYAGETPQKAGTAQYAYTFTGWAPEITSVSAEATYTAQFAESVKEYTVRFLDSDGTELQKETLSFGATPAYAGNQPQKEATAKYTYAFAGWTPEIASVSADADYTAAYTQTLNHYTVRFLDEDESLLQSTVYAYGDTPSYTGKALSRPGTAQYSYAFSSWNPEIADVERDADYTAAYTETVNEYTVTFLDEDSQVLQTASVPYGETPAYTGETPAKAGTAQYSYAFAGWDPAIEAVSGDAAYTAVYTQTLNHYTVRFLDEDETLLQTTDYAWGETPAYTGKALLKPDTAQYTYVFSHWNPEIATVEQDAEYIASYAETVNQYTVSFLDENGRTLQSLSIPYGETPAYTGKTPEKAGTAQYTYTFAGWTPAIEKVSGDAAYSAAFTTSVNSYAVTFLDEDGKVLQTASVPYGETPAAPGKVPEKAGTAQYTYTFAGWTPAITAVSGEATYTAAFTQTLNSYTVTFLDEDGKVLQTASVPYGETPAYTGKVPEKAGTAQYTYTFAGWTPAITAVSGEATYTATFTTSVNSYAVTFLNEDGTELQSDLVPWGETPAYTGETPQKAATERYAYDFTGWTPAIKPVAGEATYTAVYSETLLLYPITFRNEDATILQRGEVRLGETPAYTGETPTKEPTEKLVYTFSGWNPVPVPVPVSGEATYTAVFTSAPRTYTVQFVNDDGTVLQSEELAWGETPVYHGETPTKESTAQYEFTFSGWNPAAFSPVSGDATYTAEYTETVRTYTIRFIYEDGVVHETLQLKYGDYPLCKEDPYRNGTRDYEVRPVRTLVTEDFDYTLHCVADDVDFDPLTNKTDKDLGKSGIENLFWGQVDSDHQQITLTDGDPKSGIPGVGLSNNPDGSSSLPDGSTVQLQWIEKPESTLQSLKESGKIRSETLNFFYDHLDDGQKFWLFQLNAYDPSGEKLEQEDFQSTMEVYLELGDDWDIEDINAIYLDNDEILEKPEIVYKNVNGVMKRFAVLRMEHFSTYAVILRGTFGSNPQQEQY